MKARAQNDIIQWFKFFLVGVIETAKSSIETFDGILKLQKEVDEKLQTLGGRLNNAQLLLDQLYQHPMIDATKAKEITNLTNPTVYKLLEDLERLGILREITGGKEERSICLLII